MRIVVKNIINSPIAAFHTDGSLVFEKLEQSLNKGVSILVGFEGITQCSTQFLNASVGKLYLQHSPEIVDSLLSFDYAGLPHLAFKLAEVRENAIHSKTYDAILEEATT